MHSSYGVSARLPSCSCKLERKRQRMVLQTEESSGDIWRKKGRNKGERLTLEEGRRGYFWT